MLQSADGPARHCLLVNKCASTLDGLFWTDQPPIEQLARRPQTARRTLSLPPSGEQAAY
jgi:hypothetical protein